MELPVFTYHPDPVATGAVVRSPNQCVVCKQSREFVYVGPTYSEEEIAEESICPWCIADGSANQRFGVEFTDSALIGDGLAGTGPVSVEIIEEIAHRTPGFIGWQQECCSLTVATAAHSSVLWDGQS